jgi:dihydroorotate dehydrogenase (fumarate)
MYYIPTDAALSSQELEKTYIDLVSDVKKQINLPLAVKLSPFFTSLPSLAKGLEQAGADGLVLFNRFIQPDLDIETLEVIPSLQLSTSSELRLPLRWTALLYGKVHADLALTSGVHTVQDVVKSVMAGACVTMLASELLVNGTRRITELNSQLLDWMEKYEYKSITQMKGSMSQKNVAEPAAFERANYMRALTSYDNESLA